LQPPRVTFASDGPELKCVHAGFGGAIRRRKQSKQQKAARITRFDSRLSWEKSSLFGRPMPNTFSKVTLPLATFEHLKKLIKLNKKFTFHLQIKISLCMDVDVRYESAKNIRFLFLKEVKDVKYIFVEFQLVITYKIISVLEFLNL